MRGWPGVSFVIVHRGSPSLLAACLASIRDQDYPAGRIEVLVVEEGKTGSARRMLKPFPRARHLEIGENHYCRANNIAVREARSPLVALVNNDCRLDRGWLARLAAALELDPGLAGVMGKILLPSGRIYSAGHEDLGYGHVRDLGFREPDGVRFDLPGPRDSLTHAACLYRRFAFLAAGGLDEEFRMYYDDVDLGFRLRKRGWRLFYAPAARAVHARGPETARRWTELFCHRNRLLFAARHRPRSLPEWLFHSRLAVDPGWHPALYQVLPEVLRRLPGASARRTLPRLGKALARRGVPPDFLRMLLRRSACAAGLAKPALAVYDHAFHFVGGGQKYGARMAWALRDRLSPFYLANVPPPRGLGALHGGRLPFPVEVVRVDRRLGRTQVDPGIVRELGRNPLEAVSRAAARAPFFLNANMVPAVRPRSDVSVFLCHFPDQPPAPPFHVPEYDLLICNSRYTRSWILRRWNLSPHRLVYPPVDMKAPRRAKEKIILSVARFDASRSKQQHRMVEAFARMRLRGWKLVLAGGAVPGERSELPLHAVELSSGGADVEILPNLPAERIKDLYARASIFWHLCGIGERDPVRREHFGMSVCEAMQNGCVPVVFDGGGLRESVRNGEDGFRIRTLEQLVARTRRLIRDETLRTRMGKAARASAARFGAAHFDREVRKILLPLVDRYLDPRVPEVDVVKNGSFMKGCRQAWERACGP